jgi:hypothetical protein
MNQGIQPETRKRSLCILALIGFISSFVCGLAGLIMSIIGLVKIGKAQGGLSGKGFGIAGIIVGALMFIFQTIWTIAFIEGELM